MRGKDLHNSIREVRDMQMILKIQYVLLLVLLVASFIYVFLWGNVLFEKDNLVSIRLNILNLGLLVLLSLAAYFVKRSVMQQLRNKHELVMADFKKYRNMYFVRAAMYETVCIFSLLIYVLWGHEYSLVLGFAIVLLLRLIFPSDERIAKEFPAKLDI